MLVETPLSVAEEAEDATSRLSAPFRGAPGYKRILRLLVAGGAIELDNASGLVDFRLLFEVCKVTELRETPELRDEVLLLKAFDKTGLDDALELKAVVFLYMPGDENELDEDLELKEVLSSIEGGKMIGSDDSLELKDVVTSVEVYKITDDEPFELNKVRELAELNDSFTVFDIFDAAAEAAAEFTMEPKAVEEVISWVLSCG